jgi:hypothetical protein
VDAALGGSAGAPVTTGGDYACRERVFAPPAGTFDADWVTPAVLEAHPDASHAQARAAVVRAWTAVRSLTTEGADVTTDAVLDRLRAADDEPAPLDRTAAAVVVAAVRAFGAG